ncbi:MAG: adenylate kinase [Clostridia bacterium]|nr:adenylate kinase [Clostridia bacterium]
MRIILFGGPGAGKGTQASAMCARLGIPSVSTGNIIREAISTGSSLGVEFKKYTDKGELVPDSLVIDMLKERIARPDCANGYILDGFPRSIPQAEALDEMGVEIDAVVSLEVSDEAIERRMTGRRVCPKCGESFHLVYNPPKVEMICDKCGAALVQRSDDKAETVRERLKVYHSQTEPAKAYYEAKGKLKKIDGSGNVEAITALIFEALGL